MSEQAKSTVITLRLNRTLVKAVDKIAKNADRSRNWILVRYIEAAVAKAQAESR